MSRFLVTLGVAILCVGACCPKMLQAFDNENWRDRIQLHGFASQGYLSSDLNNYYADTEEGSFQFNEFGLTLYADPLERLQIGIQLLSRDLGDLGNNKVTLDWASGTYRWRDWFEVSAGQLKLPWGIYNESRDIDLLRPWIFLPSSLYPEELREIYSSYTGVKASGDLLFDTVGGLTYSLGYGEKVLSDDSIEYLFDAPETIFQNLKANIRNLAFAGIEWDTPLSGLRLSSMYGRFHFDWSVEANSNAIWEEYDNISAGTVILDHSSDQDTIILSAEYVRNGLTIATEYVHAREQDVVSHNFLTGTTETSSEKDAEESYYVSLAYRLTPWLQCGAYYSVYYPDGKDGRKNDDSKPAYNAWQKELVLTTRIDFNDSWIVKFEGHAIHGTASVPESVNPDGLSEHSFLFAIKTTFSF